MAEYYRNETRSIYEDDRRRERGAFMTFVDLAMTGLSVVVAVMMLLTYFVPYVHTRGWLFPVLGLFAPATYVVTVALMLYWIIRWRWIRASVLLFLTVVGLFYLHLFLRPEFRHSKYEEEPAVKGKSVCTRTDLSIMTYNVRNFFASDGQSSRDTLLAWVRAVDPDILCLQEFNVTAGGGTREEVDSLMADYFSTPTDGLSRNVIFSRFRILQWGHLSDSTKIRTLWADLLLNGDTVRIYANHLLSTQIKREDDEFLSRDNFLTDTAREEKVRSIVRRIRDNSIVRAAQTDTLVAAMSGSPYARIVCGDFNDTPMSYVYHRMSRGLVDAFRMAGKGYSSTYRGFSNMLRIDFVLLSPDYEVLSYETADTVDFSDHRPVLVKFRKRENN